MAEHNSHEPSHVAVFKWLKPSLQVPNFTPYSSAKALMFFITLNLNSLGR
jgi:hypothetical protein